MIDGKRVAEAWESWFPGPRAGSEVVQLYVTPAEAMVPRPKRELKAFAKVHLAAGESRDLTLTLGRRDFAWFDGTARQWVVTAGQYGLVLARNADGADRVGAVDLPAQVWAATER